MFDDDLEASLELTVTTKGLGWALPAATVGQGSGSSSSSTLSSSLCCSVHLCV